MAVLVTALGSAVLVAVVVLIALEWTGNDAVRPLTPGSRVTLPIDLPPVPYISELPPAVAGAANSTLADDPSDVVGPRDPRIALEMSNRGSDGLYLEAVGGDGTLYVAAQGHYLWAGRDGRFQWGHAG